MPNIATIPGGDYAAYPVLHPGKTTTINSHTGMLARPAFRGHTQITKPNPNADISLGNIATITGVVNPVFTVSAADGYAANKTVAGEFCEKDTYRDNAIQTNCKKIIFNGTELWELFDSNDTVWVFTTNLPFKANRTVPICTHFEYNDGAWSAANKLRDVFYIADNNITVYIQIGKNNFNGLEQFIAWLKQRSVTVYYELAAPVTTYTNYDLPLTDGANTLSCDSAILQDVTWMEIDSRPVPYAGDALTLGGRPLDWINTQLSNKVNVSGATMQGDFDVQGHKMQFNIPGRYSFFAQNDGDHLRFYDHDGHMLLQFGYNHVPLTVGGREIATVTRTVTHLTPLNGFEVSDNTTCNLYDCGAVKFVSAELRFRALVPSGTTILNTGFANNHGPIVGNVTNEYGSPVANTLLWGYSDGTIRVMHEISFTGNVSKINGLIINSFI